MTWKKLLDQGSEMILASASPEGRPNAAVVVSLGFTDGKLLIGACEMVSTLRNIKENGDVCIVAMRGKEYYRIRGRASCHAAGKHLALARERERHGYEIQEAILVEIEEVFDLDKHKKLL